MHYSCSHLATVGVKGLIKYEAILFFYVSVIKLLRLLSKWWQLFHWPSSNNNNNKRQFVRRRNMSVDIPRAPYRQSGNIVRDSSTETRLWVIWLYKKMGFQALFKFVKCWRAPDVVSTYMTLPVVPVVGNWQIEFGEWFALVSFTSYDGASPFWSFS